MKYSIKVEINVKEVKVVYSNPSIKSDVQKLVSGRELLMGVCKKLRDLLDAILVFKNKIMLHRKRTRSSSIALGIVNPSLTCQQTCRLGNNNACAFCKFKKINKNTQSPTRESFSPNSIAKRSVEECPFLHLKTNPLVNRHITR